MSLFFMALHSISLCYPSPSDLSSSSPAFPPRAAITIRRAVYTLHLPLANKDIEYWDFAHPCVALLL